MAYDKIVNSIMLDNGLTFIADSIRNRSETVTTDELIFPDGFVNAINNIRTIVGGTTQPSNPIEDTIWINTDVPITKVEFNPSKPDSPQQGWVNIPSGSNSWTTPNLDVSKIQNIDIFRFPRTAYQYVNDVWIYKEAKIYKSGAWVDLAAYLYRLGSQCTEITGGWTASGIKAGSSWTATAPTITFNSNNMYTYLAGGSGSGIAGFTHTKNKIDLTDISTIIFNGSVTVSSDFSPALCVASTVSSSAALNTAAVHWNLIDGATLDVSNLTGSYYIGFYLRAPWNYVDTKCSVTCTQLYMK